MKKIIDEIIDNPYTDCQRLSNSPVDSHERIGRNNEHPSH